MRKQTISFREGVSYPVQAGRNEASLQLSNSQELFNGVDEYAYTLANGEIIHGDSQENKNQMLREQLTIGLNDKKVAQIVGFCKSELEAVGLIVAANGNRELAKGSLIDYFQTKQLLPSETARIKARNLLALFENRRSNWLTAKKINRVAAKYVCVLVKILIAISDTTAVEDIELHHRAILELLAEAPTNYIQNVRVDYQFFALVINLAQAGGSLYQDYRLFFMLNLENGNLDKKKLSGVSLSWKKLTEISLVKTVLYQVDFSHSDLIKGNLESADMYKANLQFTDFGEANLENASLIGALAINANFQSANINGADFSHSDLTAADFSQAVIGSANFSGSNLTHAVMKKVDLTQAIINQTNFYQADLSSSNLHRLQFYYQEMGGAIFLNANLEQSTFYKTNLYKSNFSQAICKLAELSDCDAREGLFCQTNFRNSELINLNFSNANCSQASFYGARMRNVNFKNANLQHANLLETELIKVDFKGANLTGVKINLVLPAQVTLERLTHLFSDGGIFFSISSIDNEYIHLKKSLMVQLVNWVENRKCLLEDKLLLIPLCNSLFINELYFDDPLLKSFTLKQLLPKVIEFANKNMLIFTIPYQVCTFLSYLSRIKPELRSSFMLNNNGFFIQLIHSARRLPYTGICEAAETLYVFYRQIPEIAKICKALPDVDWQHELILVAQDQALVLSDKSLEECVYPPANGEIWVLAKQNIHYLVKSKPHELDQYELDRISLNFKLFRTQNGSET